MATFTSFNDESSGCRTPDPLVLHGKTLAQKGLGLFEEGESGSRTPNRIAAVNIGDLRKKLERLKAERPKSFEDMHMTSPPGLTRPVENCLEGDVMKVVMNSNLAQPLSTGPSSLPLPPPLPHPEPRFILQDQDAAIKNKPANQLMNNQVVSKGSVGHPVYCAQACKYVKRKSGCKEGTNCPHCHHCFWSKGYQPHQELRNVAGPEAAQLEEAKSLANKLVSLLGGEEPFGRKPEETQVVQAGLSLGATGHPHNCAPACKYVRRRGGCMYGEACLKCHACLWSREAENISSGAGFREVVQDTQGLEAGSGSSGEGFGTLAQDVQGSIFNYTPAIRLSEILKEPPVLSTNPDYGQFQEQLPAPQASQIGFPPVHASVGTMGHPHTCGPACKYAMKPKGCKDGPLCSHCHLCRWMRYGVANNRGNKEATEVTAWMSF